jgi:D-xylose transport system substrate-binding protein
MSIRVAFAAPLVLASRPTTNATLFKQGAHKILDPKFKSGVYKKVAEQAVPDWDNQQALTIFEQMLEKTNNKIDGVLSANDGLANAAISALKARRLPQMPITGQDATLQGIQNILTGDQCMTVYKPIQQEVDAASKLAIALAKGQTPTGVGATTDNGSKQVPSILLHPISVTKANGRQVLRQRRLPDARAGLRRQGRVRLHEGRRLIAT